MEVFEKILTNLKEEIEKLNNQYQEEEKVKIIIMDFLDKIYNQLKDTEYDKLSQEAFQILTQNVLKKRGK